MEGMKKFHMFMVAFLLLIVMIMMGGLWLLMQEAEDMQNDRESTKITQEEVAYKEEPLEPPNCCLQTKKEFLSIVNSEKSYYRYRIGLSVFVSHIDPSVLTSLKDRINSIIYNDLQKKFESKNRQSDFPGDLTLIETEINSLFKEKNIGGTAKVYVTLLEKNQFSR